jgi:hypothetical protein
VAFETRHCDLCALAIAGCFWVRRGLGKVLKKLGRNSLLERALLPTAPPAARLLAFQPNFLRTAGVPFTGTPAVSRKI